MISRNPPDPPLISRASLTTSKPATKALPDVGRVTPVKILMVAVFPAPLGPQETAGHREGGPVQRHHVAATLHKVLNHHRVNNGDRSDAISYLPASIRLSNSLRASRTATKNNTKPINPMTSDNSGTKLNRAARISATAKYMK